MKVRFIAVSIILFILWGCSSSLSVKLGNTNGNLANFGYRVKVKDGVVFANSRDHLRIYRSKSDGSEIKQISSKSGVYLNAFEDWVYFISLDDFKILRIETNGTNEELISQHTVDPCGGMMIVDGWIYYVNNDDENRIYKMSMDGEENEMLIDVSALKLNASDEGLVFISVKDDGNQLMISDYKSGEMKVLADNVDQLTLVVQDWVYFNKASDQEKLYRVKVDGSDEMKVNDIRAFALNEHNGRLYFSDLTHNYRLSSAKPDGTDIKVLSNDMTTDLLFFDGWLYYLNHSDGGREYRLKGQDIEKVISVPKATPLASNESEIMIAGSTNSNRMSGGFFTKLDNNLIFVGKSVEMKGIYKRNLSDPEAPPEQISIDQARNLNVWKEWIYYINESDYSGIYRMKSDGSDTQIVLDQSVGNLIIVGNWMYFLNYNENQRIYKAKIDGSELTSISETEGIFAFSLDEEWLVYANGQGQTMVKVKLDGSEEQVITAYSSTFLMTHEGWIYYGDDNTNVALSKVKLDGSENQKLITNFASHVHIVQDHIYYFDGVEDAIMRMDVNGGNITKISEKGDFGWFHSIHDKLYYLDNRLFEWFEMDLR
ncbi:MAG: DUF5050 domain-containing protein [Erysipelotrichaceae bacterium]|nr:DUF5050 domain-containing protein [Erysipelotrichaceae bacterium]